MVVMSPEKKEKKKRRKMDRQMEETGRQAGRRAVECEGRNEEEDFEVFS
jgi:hypothetical protein